MMCAMMLRLDARLPIVWRTPTSLQIGVDPVRALLADVSDGDAQLIDALTIGVTRAGLDMLAERAGVAPARVDEVLAELALALRVPHSVSFAPPLAVIGHGIGAERVAAVLREAGHPVTVTVTSEQSDTRPPMAAVLVSGHVFDPFEHQRWLRRDVPHLPIVFSESGATIGPLVMPGISACLTCIEQQRTAVDSAWPALAAQLWRAAAAAESSALGTESAIEALRMLRASLPLAHESLTQPAAAQPAAAQPALTQPAAAQGAISVRLDSTTGERTIREWWPGAGCGCRELSASWEPESHQENDSVPALPAPRLSVVPTTTPATFVPA